MLALPFASLRTTDTSSRRTIRVSISRTLVSISLMRDLRAEREEEALRPSGDADDTLKGLPLLLVPESVVSVPKASLVAFPRGPPGAKDEGEG